MQWFAKLLKCESTETHNFSLKDKTKSVLHRNVQMSDNSTLIYPLTFRTHIQNTVDAISAQTHDQKKVSDNTVDYWADVLFPSCKPQCCAYAVWHLMKALHWKKHWALTLHNVFDICILIAFPLKSIAWILTYWNSLTYTLIPVFLLFACCMKG